jgi:RNA polymerase sigma factor (sigma-70 family)
MDDSDDPTKLFASRSPTFYRSRRFQDTVDPIVRPSLRAFVRGLITGCFGHGHAATNDFAFDDVTNKALFKCYRNVDGHQICRAANASGRLRIFRKFLYTIARNCVREYARVERARVEVATDQPVIQALLERQRAEAREAPLPESLRQLPRLLSLLSELPARDQRLLHLRYAAGYSWLEIAKYFDFAYSQSLLKVRAGRLRNRLERKAQLVHHDPSGDKEDDND